ncbi:MAG TPA: HAD family hydrolase [Flavitalea sp.]|nr:HAD family hydrolase [Flavitalea sp.]
MFKGIIFDLDGTIANTLPLCIEAFRRSIQPLANRTLTDEEIIATFGPSEEGTIMALAPLHYEAGIKGYLEQYEQLHSMCPDPFDGIRELLQKIKSGSSRLAMVTGKGKYSTNISLEAFDLDDVFEIIETGAPHGPRKAEGIMAVLESWDVKDKSTILYVGDAPGDIIAARKAGIPIAAVTWASTTNRDELIAMQPDYLLDSVNQLELLLF